MNSTRACDGTSRPTSGMALVFECVRAANDCCELGTAGTSGAGGDARAPWRLCLQTGVAAGVAGVSPPYVGSAHQFRMGGQRRVPNRIGLHARARCSASGSGMEVPNRVMHSRVCTTVGIRRVSKRLDQSLATAPRKLDEIRKELPRSRLRRALQNARRACRRSRSIADISGGTCVAVFCRMRRPEVMDHRAAGAGGDRTSD